MSNKKYNPEDFKDAEFITVGDGPVRVQIVKAKNLSMGDIVYISKKLFEIECEMGLVKPWLRSQLIRVKKPRRFKTRSRPARAGILKKF